MKGIGFTMGLTALLAVTVVTVLVVQLQITGSTPPNVTVMGAFIVLPVIVFMLGIIAGHLAAVRRPDANPVGRLVFI